MATVAFLQTYTMGEPDPFPYGEWRRLAQDRGIEIMAQLVRGPSDSEGYRASHQLIEDAEALVVMTSCFLHDVSLVKRVADRVASGTPLLVKLPAQPDPQIRDFLAQFDLEPTSIGLYDAEGRGKQLRTLVLDRERDPGAFRDSQLFAGVNRLVVVQAQVLRYGPRAFPLLVVPEERAEVVDLSSDLPPDWVGRELACIAGYFMAGETVIAISGSILLDRLIGPEGLEWPGGEANHQWFFRLQCG
jgi:hypothetical protein